MGNSKSLSQYFVRSMRKDPIIAVIGATGTGKTKLAIEICKHINGEIINADAMQVYRGLDISTNKATVEELAACKHHLIGYVSPTHTNYHVHDFINEAIPIISKLQSAGKVPVVVGGTSYYIESLLWNMLLATQNMEQIKSEKFREECDALETDELYSKLMKVDPDSKNRILRKERRKIIRGLEVADQSGQPMSKLLKNQHDEVGLADTVRGQLRYPHVCVLWIHSDQKVLDERINLRVDKMLSAGLLNELKDFHDEYNRSRLKDGQPKDYTRGMFQCIGFKEFHDYLVMSPEEREKNVDKLSMGIDVLKRNTRKYARRQVKRINGRFLRQRGPDEKIPFVYKLDSSNVEDWTTAVREPAFGIVKAYLENSKIDYRPEKRTAVGDTLTFNHCDVCGIDFTSLKSYKAHMKGYRHRRQKKLLKCKCKSSGGEVASPKSDKETLEAKTEVAELLLKRNEEDTIMEAKL